MCNSRQLHLSSSPENWMLITCCQKRAITKSVVADNGAQSVVGHFLLLCPIFTTQNTCANTIETPVDCCDTLWILFNLKLHSTQSSWTAGNLMEFNLLRPNSIVGFVYKSERKYLCVCSMYEYTYPRCTPHNVSQDRLQPTPCDLALDRWWWMWRMGGWNLVSVFILRHCSPLSLL